MRKSGLLASPGKFKIVINIDTRIHIIINSVTTINIILIINIVTRINIIINSVTQSILF